MELLSGTVAAPVLQTWVVMSSRVCSCRAEMLPVRYIGGLSGKKRKHKIVGEPVGV